MEREDFTKSKSARRVPEGLVALGVALVLAQALTHLLFSGPAVFVTWSTQLSVLLTAGFAVPVVLGGIWLRRREVAPDRYPRVAAWCLGVSLAILLVNVAMILTWPAATVGQNVAWAVQAAAMGAAGGILFGSIEARAIERARAVERARVHADHLKAQREWLEYLNSLLRHEVLNTANVIAGSAQILLEDHDGDSRTRSQLERIARRSRDMSDVIRDVRLLIDASKDEVEFRPVDVVDVLRGEVAAIEDEHEEVSVSTSVPERAVVSADDLLARAFSNLLENAVEHNDAADPQIEVAVEVGPEVVSVSIADDGPGIPADERETLFERNAGGDHGLGLYLVRTLVERYGGSVELAGTGPDGSVFTVDLPLAAEEVPSGEGVPSTDVAGPPARPGPDEAVNPLPGER